MLPYTRANKIENLKLSIIMGSYKSFLRIARLFGYDVRLTTESDTLELYYNDDYPDIILVDKDTSSRIKGEKI